MTKVQAAYNLGIYGVVVNLGSIVVRTLFQPVEEAAFMAFSQTVPTQSLHKERMQTLLLLLKGAILLGLLATAFGPSNAYIVLHVLYGPKYSTTEAPAALALYSPYILLLAVNGILESFVHAVALGSELWLSHVALFVATTVQTIATMWLVTSYGTLGMILADSLGMMLRIAYCLHFVWKYIDLTWCSSDHQTQLNSKRQERSGASNFSRKLLVIKEAVPNAASLSALLAAGSLAGVSAAVFLGKGLLASFTFRAHMELWSGTILHVTIETLLLTVLGGVLYRTEVGLWHAFNKPRTKQV